MLSPSLLTCFARKLDFVNYLPVGVSFLGTAWDEANLINAAYSFEQENKFFPIPK